MPFLFSLLIIALMVGALVDIIRREDSQVRFLPKMAWIIIVILLPLIGSLLWFAIGREYSEAGLRIPRMRAATPPAPTRADPVPLRPVDSRSTEEQIADLDREIEEWRLRAELEKRRRDEDGTATGSDAAAR
ncbi:PLDc N-terminal domain-containing protein [Microbacterium sp. 1.5R]|uniref:PLDc N-terminal domain-containing protein n=1 Tax=Microbacterium sp. 1.5R TaxID=1916917 RepID=UPI0011A365D5|nr:PLDc N-terminal domain-containing protein [Microbacterium sp. 1.5R]